MKKNQSSLPQELRAMVKWSVAILGEVIGEELGNELYSKIEETRKKMASTRTLKTREVEKVLLNTEKLLKGLNKSERFEFAKAYTLMLELMNSCENAYRTFRLKQRKTVHGNQGADAIYFVLTAHPTEARSPDNIQIFHEIQKLLTRCFEKGPEGNASDLKALIELAWKIDIVRMRKPRVQDEADHVYSILLRDENLSTLLDFGIHRLPVYVRSWVGGDKDGHPGVDETVMIDSLQMSRNLLRDYLKKQIRDVKNLSLAAGFTEIQKEYALLIKSIHGIKALKQGDLAKVLAVHRAVARVEKAYLKNIGESLPLPLARVKQLIRVFPGIVVPLELREDAEVLMSDQSGSKTAIGRMLSKIGKLSQGGDPCFYARGLIISMARSAEHVRVVGKIIKKQVGNSKIPVVPLFEQKESLDAGASIIRELLEDSKIRKIVEKDWGGVVEIMVGYSDSAKESGVISSRFSILESIVSLEKTCSNSGVKAVFFHGSGGSIDRGGGSIKDQLAGMPGNSLNVYKATIQGEMVERTFSSPEILESQLLQIGEMTESKKRSKSEKKNPELIRFADRVKNHYRTMIEDKAFLEMVELATPYPYLSALKIGSRPSKRSIQGLSVSGLRAIPWVLCWTQMRILFPTWWGIGSAWNESSETEKKKIKKGLIENSVFKTYIHALGFTLAKIEPLIFEQYVNHSKIESESAASIIRTFRKELQSTWKFFSEITGEKNPLWFRPWLGESIELRAPMIHPLNLLGIIAQQEKDLNLLRISVTGIASGMLTTG